MPGNYLSDTYFTTQGIMARAKFVHRNEIISGISDILVAAESSNTGGTAHQVEIARRQKKTILTLEPQDDNPIAKKGFDKFLELGAIPVASVEDVFKILNKKAAKKPKSEDLTLRDFAQIISTYLHYLEFIESKNRQIGGLISMMG